MNAKQLSFTFFSLVAVSLTMMLTAAYFNVQNTFSITSLAVSLLLSIFVYFRYISALKGELEEQIRTSNTDLHPMYEASYRFKGSDNAVKELYKNLNKIQEDYKDHFAREPRPNKDVFRFLDTQYDKPTKRTILTLQKKVLTLPHPVAKRMLEAFAEDYPQ